MIIIMCVCVWGGGGSEDKKKILISRKTQKNNHLKLKLFKRFSTLKIRNPKN